MRENRETPWLPVAERWRPVEKAMSDKPTMHGGGESYSGRSTCEQPNKGGRPSAEDPEGAPEERPLAKENTEQSNQCRTQSRESGPNGLGRVREVAKKDGRCGSRPCSTM